MLERHIMQAQARAMSADERQLHRSQTMSSGFPDLGLPPGNNAVTCIYNVCSDLSINGIFSNTERSHINHGVYYYFFAAKLLFNINYLHIGCPKYNYR